VKVQRLLGERMGKDVWFYSFTLEPEKDSPEIMADYAERYGVGPGWLFLTGNPADMETLRQNLGFAWSDPVLDGDLTNHIGTVKMANEPRSWWGAAPSYSDPRQIARLLAWMAPEEGQRGTIGHLPGEKGGSR
jgi:protein SCO1/2